MAFKKGFPAGRQSSGRAGGRHGPRRRRGCLEFREISKIRENLQVWIANASIYNSENSRFRVRKIGTCGFNFWNFLKFRKSRKIFRFEYQMHQFTIAKIQGFELGKLVIAVSISRIPGNFENPGKSSDLNSKCINLQKRKCKVSSQENW